MDEPIHIDLASLAGVPSEVFEAADRGDRQAQKMVLRSLMTQDASAAALTTGHWTDWVLRAVATGSRQAIADALGAIAQAGRSGTITPVQLAALNGMYEQHFGPGEVGEPASSQVRAAFAGTEPEETVVDLFLVADRLASGSQDITASEVLQASEAAARVGSTVARAFFLAVTGQLLARSDPQAAFGYANDALKLLSEAAEDDDIYTPKVGQTAILAGQIAQIAGEPSAASLLHVIHADAIAAYQEAEREASGG